MSEKNVIIKISMGMILKYVEISYIHTYIFGTNARNRARSRTFSKLRSALTRTDLDHPFS